MRFGKLLLITLVSFLGSVYTYSGIVQSAPLNPSQKSYQKLFTYLFKCSLPDAKIAFVEKELALEVDPDTRLKALAVVLKNENCLLNASDVDALKVVNQDFKHFFHTDEYKLLQSLIEKKNLKQ